MTGDYVYRDLTKGSISKGLIAFAVPMIAGNILQQFYNILAPVIGETGIWLAIPIGWFVADLVGYGYYFLKKKKMLN